MKKNWIKARREELKISQKSLLKMTGWKQPRLSLYENWKRELSYEDAVFLAPFLKTTADYLLTGKGHVAESQSKPENYDQILVYFLKAWGDYFQKINEKEAPSLIKKACEKAMGLDEKGTKAIIGLILSDAAEKQLSTQKH